jgi:hypothetical protein
LGAGRRRDHRRTSQKYGQSEDGLNESHCGVRVCPREIDRW